MGTPFVQPSQMGYNVGAPIGLSSTQPIDDRQMSRLPVESQPWPPPDQTPIAFSHRIWDAWHTGDRQKLAWCYYNLGANSPYGRAFFATTGEKGMPTPRPGQYRGGLLGSIEHSFWLSEASPSRQGKNAPASTSRSQATSPPPRRPCCSPTLPSSRRRSPARRAKPTRHGSTR